MRRDPIVQHENLSRFFRIPAFVRFEQRGATKLVKQDENDRGPEQI